MADDKTLHQITAPRQTETQRNVYAMIPSFNKTCLWRVWDLKSWLTWQFQVNETLHCQDKSSAMKKTAVPKPFQMISCLLYRGHKTTTLSLQGGRDQATRLTQKTTYEIYHWARAPAILCMSVWEVWECMCVFVTVCRCVKFAHVCRYPHWPKQVVK